MFPALSANAAAVLNNQLEETLGGRSEKYSFQSVLEIETLGQFVKEDIVWTISSVHKLQLHSYCHYFKYKVVMLNKNGSSQCRSLFSFYILSI